MLLSVDFYENFIDEKDLSKPSVFSSQAACIQGHHFHAPKAHRFAAECDVAFSSIVFNIWVTKIDPVVKANGITDDVVFASMVYVYQ